MSLNSELGQRTLQGGCLRGADILVCQLGRLSSRPEAGLESPANRQAWKACPTLFDAESQAPKF